MKNGGKRTGAGRKPGSKNRVATRVREHALALAAKGDIMPLDFLLNVMRAEEPVMQPNEPPLVYLGRLKRWDEDRLEAAKAAAPYCHARLATVEHTGADGQPWVVKHEVVFAMPKVGNGQGVGA